MEEKTIKQTEPPPKINSALKTCLILCIVFIIAVLIAGSAGYFIYNHFSIPGNLDRITRWFEPPFPELSGLKEVEYSWSYKGKDYSTQLSLYQSVYEYYNQKTKGIGAGEENEDIENYLIYPEEDRTIPDLVAELNQLGVQNGLNPNEIVEMATIFVQTIPYDEEQAKIDITKPKYPYEVLYLDKGICSDKSLLLVAILRQLGYGASIFAYWSDDHMAAGVQCPRQYSNQNSGYCVIESTVEGFRIGTTPQLKKDGQAVPVTTLPEYEKTQGQEQQHETVGQAELFVKTTGKGYTGIIKTLALEKEMSDLESYFASELPKIEANNGELESLRAQLDTYYKVSDYDNYNRLVPVYNNLLYKTQTMIKKYNANVERYNYLVREYNYET